MHHLSNLPPGLSNADIERQAGDDRDALRDAIAEALHRHLHHEAADDVWARLDDRRAVDEAEDVGDIERAIRRHFDRDDARCGLVLDDVRPVAVRVLGG